MIIDIHTHVFPDALAKKAMSALKSSINNLYPSVHDGTVSGLLEKMDEWHIDISVIQPVITKASQVKKTNDWIRSVCSDRIIGFGGIYPHSDNYKEDIDYVIDLGLKGLKFHAEYQNFILDDDRMLRIYDYALSKGLILMHHAGFDPAFPPPCKSSPKRFARIGEMLKGGTIIAAHLGGHEQWDEVEEDLAGSNIYLDTSMGFQYFSEEQFLRIVKKHGVDKILFASDSPWSYADSEIKKIRSLPLTEDEKNMILCKNAESILGNK
jgi:predicted TIM-barrel fold metal-dependent hydrolase